jgi:hypothetical protein
VTGLRVNSLTSPLTIDDARPHFSFKLDGAGNRATASQGYEIILREAGVSAPLWASGKVTSNRTTYIKMGAAAANLTSDKEYMWSARCFVGGTPTAWSNASFSTALLEQSDWHAAQWVTSPGGDAPGQFASQVSNLTQSSPHPHLILISSCPDAEGLHATRRRRVARALVPGSTGLRRGVFERSAARRPRDGLALALAVPTPEHKLHQQTQNQGELRSLNDTP